MSDKLLDENQSAIKLGITKELLYAYVRKGVKGQKLKVKSGKREIKFSEKELEEYENFLKDKWRTNPKEKRPDVPKFIKEFLKVESNGQCARCFSGHRMDDAHIIPWSECFSHFHHNLIRLCTDCHTKYDDGIISREEIAKLKNGLISKLRTSLLSKEGLSINSIRSVPKPDLNFVGREEEIKKINNTLEKERITIITGAGGVGKTELLIKSLEKCDELVKWFKTEKYDSILDLKREILMEFNSSTFTELLSSLDQKSDLIIVFDGFEKLFSNDGDETLNFLGDLIRHTSKVKFILTTQINVDDYSFRAKTIIIKGLKKSESRILLSNLLPNLDIDNLEWVIEFSNGHVLTIKLLIGLINFYKDSEKVKSKLKEKGVEFIDSPLRKEQNAKSSLNLSLKLSYDSLNDSERYVLTYLTNFPIGCKDYSLEIFNNSKLIDDIYIDDVDYIIAKLNQFHLIEDEYDSLNQSRIIILNPIKQYIISNIKSKSLKIWHQLRIVAFKNLLIEAVVIYQHNSLTERWEEAIWRYEVELPNYIYAINKSIHSAYCKDCLKYCDEKDYLNIITGFAGVLYKYLFLRGHYSYGLKINEEGAKAHIQLGEYDLAIEDLTMMAQLYLRNNDLKSSKRILEQMKLCSSKIKDSSKLFYLYFIEGEIIREHQPDEAINLFSKGLELLSDFEDINFKNSNTALLNAEIGRVYEKHYRDFKKALENYTIASDIYFDIKDYSNLYSCFYHIGNCYSGEKKIKLSLKYYKDSLIGFIRTGQKQYIGNALSEIARLRVDHPSLDYSFIEENVLITGMLDIKEEIEVTIKTDLILDNFHLNAGLNNNQVYKLFQIIKFLSFMKQLNSKIREWSNEILLLLGKERDIKYSYPWFFLNIATQISLITDGEQDENLIILKNYCYLHGGEVEHDIFDPFKWLALWLEENKIENTTRGQLFAEFEIF